MDWGLTGMLIALALVALVWVSQQKLKNKMLCYFIRPNRQRIEKWVPLYSSYVVFDRGKYGIGQYIVNPNCITMQWFDRGVNKLFPVLIPTIEFKWDTPNPLDPTTFQATWQTPEARNAAWQEHQHNAFARAAAQQASKKKGLAEWLPFIIMGGLILIVLLFLWNMSGQIGALQQAVNLRR